MGGRAGRLPYFMMNDILITGENLKKTLDAINDLSKLLDASIKFKSESAEERVKVKYCIMNYIYDKGLIKLWLASAYTYFIVIASGDL